MEFIENLCYARKEFVYNIYQALVKEPKEYEKITRKKMAEVILNFYQNPKQLIRLLTDHDIQLLKNIEKGHDDYNQLNSAYLKQNHIVGMHIKENKMIIPDELTDSVHAITSGEVIKEDIDTYMELILGMLYVEGPIPFDMLIKKLTIYLQNMDEDEIGDALIEAPFFNSRAYLDDDLIVINDYMPLMKYERKQTNYFAQVFQPEELIDIGNTRFNLQNKKIKNFIEKHQNVPDYVFHMILNDVQLLDDHYSDIIMQYFDENDEDELLEVIQEIYSYTLHGLSMNEYKKHMENKERLSKQFVDKKQTNAHLSEKDSELFNRLYFSLLNFVNQEFEIAPHIQDLSSSMIDPNAIIETRDALFNYPAIIDKYCNLNPDHFSKEEIRLIKKFKNMRVSNFTIVKHDEKFSYFLDNHTCYGVKGITNNIQDILQHSLPAMVRTCLLPFKNQIIYDGYLQSFPIGFGDGSLQMFLNEMKKHKPVFQLIDKH